MTFVVMDILQPLPDSHSRSPAGWYEPPTNSIVYAYTKLPAVLLPLERPLPLLRPTDAGFVPNHPRGFTMGELLRVVLEGIRKREVSTNL